MRQRCEITSWALIGIVALATACESKKAGGSGGRTGSGGSATGGRSGSGGSTPATGGAGSGGTIGTGGVLATGGSSSGGTIGTAGAPAGGAGMGGGGNAGGNAGGTTGGGGMGGVAMATCGPFANGGLGGGGVGVGGGGGAGGNTTSPMMTFFVSSLTNMTGNLGGLAGADQRCQTLATAVGRGGKTWHAYLSVEHDAANANMPAHARDRIGTGPWHNARGALVAATLAELHARKGDAAIFLDEHGNMINGQWTGSPTPNQHDVLTGSNPDGTVAPGKTCSDWTSSAAPPDAGVPDGGTLPVARIGHSDGIGPMCGMATTPNDLTSWNSSHDNAGCNDTAPRGGAGRIYCFAVN